MRNTFNTQTAKFLAAIAQAMPPEISSSRMQDFIEKPRYLRQQLHQALSPYGDIPRFISLGKCRTPKEYIDAMLKSGIIIEKGVEPLILKVATESRAELEIVPVKLGDLGFKREEGLTYIHAKRAEVVRAASELGLSLCPAEAALALRLAYTTHHISNTYGGCVHVMMDPIVSEKGTPLCFILNSEVRDFVPGTQWLSTSLDQDDIPLVSNDTLIFCRR